MRLFLSYAHEQRPLAARLAARLEEERHRAFFDRTDLAPGDPYDARIRSEIKKASLFIFLVSRHSVEPKSYALTELGLARKRWRRAAGRILPVMVESVPEAAMPEFGVDRLSPEGDWIADIVARVAEIAQRHRHRRVLAASWVAGGLALAAGVVLLFGSGIWKPTPKQPCLLLAQFQPSADRAASMPEGLVLHVVAGGVSHDYAVGNDGTCRFAIEGSAVGEWSVDLTSADGLAWGRASLRGCPPASTRVVLDEGSSLAIAPQ